MACRYHKRHHKVDRLLSLLTSQEQDAFNAFVQFGPSYSDIQAWLGSKGHKISVNGVHRWWKASFPSADESRILRGIAMELGQDFNKPPYNSVLRLVITAAQILCDHSTSRLTNVEPQMLLEKQLELFTGAREMAMLSHLSKP